MYTQKSCHCPDASAGPNERAVLSDAPRQRPERDGGQADRGGDGQRGGRADRAGAGRDAHDDQHQQRREDHLDDEARPTGIPGTVAPRSAGRAGQMASSRSAARVAPVN